MGSRGDEYVRLNIVVARKLTDKEKEFFKGSKQSLASMQGK